MGSTDNPNYAKTGLGVADWARDRCVGQLRLTETAVSAGLPDLGLREAVDRGARALLIGVAPIGGKLQPEWRPALVEALEQGLDIVAGLHARLNRDAVLSERAAQLGRRLFDVREPPADLPVGSGERRSGRRILTVGTDCALGKKYTALALTKRLQDGGIAADFRATGQTGIMISGSGIPIDAVVSDFVAGAAEQLSPAASPDHVDVVEGQGSLFHPGYAGVSLGLLHGTQPDLMVLCHEAGRTHVSGYPDYAIPSLEDAIALHLTCARRVNPQARMAGISLNTARLSEDRAASLIETTSRTLRLPVADPVRDMGLSGLVEACI